MVQDIWTVLLQWCFNLYVRRWLTTPRATADAWHNWSTDGPFHLHKPSKEQLCVLTSFCSLINRFHYALKFQKVVIKYSWFSQSLFHMPSMLSWLILSFCFLFQYFMFKEHMIFVNFARLLYFCFERIDRLYFNGLCTSKKTSHYGKYFWFSFCLKCDESYIQWEMQRNLLLQVGWDKILVSLMVCKR